MSWNQYMLSAPRLCARRDLFWTPLVSAVEVGDVARVPSLAQSRGVQVPVGADLACHFAWVPVEVIDDGRPRNQ